MFIQDDLRVKNYWEIGVVKEATAEWNLFRCRAESPHMKHKFYTACEMLNSGENSIREVSRVTGYAKNTVCELLKKLLALREKNGLGDIKCPCGTPISVHRGWCKYRYENSEKRKEYWESFLKRDRLKTVPYNENKYKKWGK